MRQTNQHMKNALLLFLFCYSACTMAQENHQPYNTVVDNRPYAKGTWLVGLQAGYSKGNLMTNYLITHMQGGYFVADKLLIGVNTTQSWEWYKSAYDNTLSIGPMVRYQFTRTRISPFLVASYQVGSRRSGSSEIQGTNPTGTTPVIAILSPNFPKTVHSRSFGAGVSVGITPALKLDALINWQDKAYNASDGLYLYRGVYQPQIGLTYLLGL